MISRLFSLLSMTERRLTLSLSKMSTHASPTKCRWAFDVSKWEPSREEWCVAMQSIQPGSILVSPCFLLAVKLKTYLLLLYIYFVCISGSFCFVIEKKKKEET